MPSLSEGTSRSSLEALYCGLPILLSDTDSNYKLITNKNGALVEKKDIVDGLKRLTDKKPTSVSLLPEENTSNYCYKKLTNLISHSENLINSENSSLSTPTILNILSKISTSFLFFFILYLSKGKFTSAEITLWFFLTAFSGIFIFLILD